MEPDFTPLLKKLHVQFKNPQLLIEAFTHRSYLNESSQSRPSNERLEFLGDAILSFLVSEHLYATYPDVSEGQLTNFRSTIVKTETLSHVSQRLEFGNYLFLSKGEEKGGGRLNHSLLADTFEAVLGALFLDGGLPQAHAFLKQELFPLIPEILQKELHADYKSKLQEIVQESSLTPPTYKIVKTEGPDHDKRFWVAVVIDEVERETGTGHSKQEAEQQAAALTLEKMGKL